MKNQITAFLFSHHKTEARHLRRAIRRDWQTIDQLQAQGKDESFARRQLLQHRAELHDHLTAARQSQHNQGHAAMKIANTFASLALVCLLAACAPKPTNVSGMAQALAAQDAAADKAKAKTDPYCVEVFQPVPVGQKRDPNKKPSQQCVELH